MPLRPNRSASSSRDSENPNAIPLGSSSKAGGGKKRAFEVLPAHLLEAKKRQAYKTKKGGKWVIGAPGGGGGMGRAGGKGVYLGKAQRIKEDLIQKAKLKKSYSKLLKSEGLSSERLGSRRRDLKDATNAHRDETFESEKKRGKRRLTDDVENDDDESEELGSGSIPDSDSEGSSAIDDDENRFSQEMGNEKRPRTISGGRDDLRRSELNSESGQGRARSRAGPTPPTGGHANDRRVDSEGGDATQPSLRDLKRKAYLGLSDDQLNKKLASSASKTNAHTGAVSTSRKGASATAASQARSGQVRGQARAGAVANGRVGVQGGKKARLGDRIGVMLEQIKRSKGLA